MAGKHRWSGLRVWVANADGEKHNGTLWWSDEPSVLIREDGGAGLLELPKAAEGTRWGFADDGDKT
jgi:hypothetical protein